MTLADRERRTVILVEERPGLWMALLKDRSEYIYDPESKGRFPQLAGWTSTDAAHADLTRWGWFVILPPANGTA